MANLISISRIIGSLALLALTPFSISFYVIYTLCGASDILDGFIARKTNTASKLGEMLDSISDLVFIAIVFIILIPVLTLEPWMLCWIGIIALIRLISMGIGFVKYHSISFLHTYANKATGMALFCFLFLYHASGINITVIIICCIASLSSIEELVITIQSDKLDRNVAGIFFKRR